MIFPSESKVKRYERAKLNNHIGCIVWLTGLSGSGKSTIAQALERKLFDSKHQVYILDGDNIRNGLNSNLTFSPEDRSENIRRVAEVACLMADMGAIVIVAFISPYKADRDIAKAIAKKQNTHFTEVYVNAPIQVCEKRDVKGLYAKARKGEITNFTGIDAPYEEPEHSDIIVYTDKENISQCVGKILNKLPLLPV